MAPGPQDSWSEECQIKTKHLAAKKHIESLVARQYSNAGVGLQDEQLSPNVAPDKNKVMQRVIKK